MSLIRENVDGEEYISHRIHLVRGYCWYFLERARFLLRRNDRENSQWSSSSVMSNRVRHLALCCLFETSRISPASKWQSKFEMTEQIRNDRVNSQWSSSSVMSNRVRHLALRFDDASSCSVLSIRNEQDFSCVEMTEQIRNGRANSQWSSSSVMSNKVRHLALRFDEVSSYSVVHDWARFLLRRNDRANSKWQSELSVTSVFSWRGLFPFSHTEELISYLCGTFEKFSIRIVMLKYEASALL